jgi:hypothetical protein
MLFPHNKIKKFYEATEGEVGAMADNLYERVFFSSKIFSAATAAALSVNFFDEAGEFNPGVVNGNIQTPGKFTDGIFKLNAVRLVLGVATGVQGSGYIVAEASQTNENSLNAVICNSILRFSEINKKILDIPLTAFLVPHIQENPASGASTTASMVAKNARSIAGNKILNVAKTFKRDATVTVKMLGFNVTANTVPLYAQVTLMGRFLED